MPDGVARRLARGLTALGGFLAAYYFFFGGEYDLRDLRELESRKEEVSQRVDSLSRTVDSLVSRADSLTDNPAVIERVARERYSFLRPGERVYLFVELDEADLDEESDGKEESLTPDSGGD
jgi:cell division protein FtsB